MNREKSSILNLDASLLIALMWLSNILLIFRSAGFVILILPFLLLLMEKKSPLLRNHAGQALILNFLIFILSLTLGNFVRMILVLISWIPIISLTSHTLYRLVQSLLLFLILALHLLAIIKTFKEEYLSLPLLGKLGDSLSRNIQI